MASLDGPVWFYLREADGLQFKSVKTQADEDRGVVAVTARELVLHTLSQEESCQDAATLYDATNEVGLSIDQCVDYGEFIDEFEQCEAEGLIKWQGWQGAYALAQRGQLEVERLGL